MARFIRQPFHWDHKIQGKYLRFFSLLIGLAILLLLPFDALFERTIFYMFQSRDLARGLALSQGQWIFFGPELTGGGNLPGPLYYILLALCQKVDPSWVFAWKTMIALSLTAIGLGWFFLRRGLSEDIADVWLGLSVLSLPLLYNLQFFLNSSFSPVFVLLSIFLACEAYVAKDPRSRKWLFASSCFSVGLAIQFHYSSLTVLLGACLLQLIAPSLQLQRLSRRDFLFGLFMFCFPLWPFLTWKVCGFLGYSFGTPAAFSIPGRGALSTLASVSFGSIWITAKAVLFYLFINIPAPLLILLALKSAQPHSPRSRALLPLIAVTFIPFSYVFLSPIGIRYNIPFFLALNIYCCFALQRLVREQRVLKIFNGLSAILVGSLLLRFLIFYPQVFQDPLLLGFAGLTLSLTALVLIKGYFRSPTHKAGTMALALSLLLTFTQMATARNTIFTGPHAVRANVGVWKNIWKTIREQTGWSLEVAIERMYMVNNHIDGDPRPIFSISSPSLTKKKSLDEPDGILVDTSSKSLSGFPRSLRSFALDQNLKDALREGNIRFLAPYSERPLIVPFLVLSETEVPRHFHNVSGGYDLQFPDRQILTEASERDVRRVEAGRYLFRWNFCPRRESICFFGVLMDITPGNSSYSIKARLFGLPISQASPWILPEYTLLLKKPYVTVTCGSTVHKTTLIESVGLNRTNDYLDPLWKFIYANNSIVAPLLRSWSVPCAIAPTEIHAGWEGARMDKVTLSLSLPAHDLKMDQMY